MPEMYACNICTIVSLRCITLQGWWRGVVVNTLVLINAV